MAKRQPRQGVLTKLSAAQFEQFVLPHLSNDRRDLATKLRLHAIFNYILRLLYLGCQWKELPIERDWRGRPEIHYTRIYRACCCALTVSARDGTHHLIARIAPLHCCYPALPLRSAALIPQPAVQCGRRTKWSRTSEREPEPGRLVVIRRLKVAISSTRKLSSTCCLFCSFVGRHALLQIISHWSNLPRNARDAGGLASPAYGSSKIKLIYLLSCLYQNSDHSP
jgi:transposase